jgi:hypothetical protein
LAFLSFLEEETAETTAMEILSSASTFNPNSGTLAGPDTPAPHTAFGIGMNNLVVMGIVTVCVLFV